jgi:hypothetical protein
MGGEGRGVQGVQDAAVWAQKGFHAELLQLLELLNSFSFSSIFL